ncbi:hypothetical protein NL676_027124 [Syzygium grande]|nr:hypothetical protein NL676_027124 [Syzygium grande]
MNGQVKLSANYGLAYSHELQNKVPISLEPLQRHYAVLQALALEEDDLPEIKDEAVPDEEGLARPGVVNAIEEFKLSVYRDKYEESDNAS